MKKVKKIEKPKYKIGDVVVIEIENLDSDNIQSVIDQFNLAHQIRIERSYLFDGGEDRYWLYVSELDGEQLILCDEEISFKV